MATVKLKDGSILEGTIDRETPTEIWLDEIRAFGDIVVIAKADIETMEGEK